MRNVAHVNPGSCEARALANGLEGHGTERRASRAAVRIILGHEIVGELTANWARGLRSRLSVLTHREWMSVSVTLSSSEILNPVDPVGSADHSDGGSGLPHSR
jgi:hypothetical protein